MSSNTKTGHIEVLARGVCIVDRHLLVCHTKGAANTYLPGGHVEFGETSADSLTREIMEELGGSATVEHFLGIVEHAFIQKTVPHSEVNLVFQVRIDGLTPDIPPPSLEDYIEFRWIPLDHLASSDLEPAPLRRLIPAWQGRGVELDLWDSTQAPHPRPRPGTGH
jgi:8-oxo-dGTP pyrophosphatase MutT (NUDIX family)